MNCSTAIELLPWLLNGSLDAEERRQVEEHLAGCGECRGELEQTRTAGAVYSAHPPPEALIEYAAGRTPAQVPRQVLAHHLEICPSCTEELALLRQSHTFLGVDLEGEDGEAESVPPGATVLAGPWTARRWRHLALAASLAGLVAFGVAGWSLLQPGAGGAGVPPALARAEERARELAAENERLRTTGAETRRRADELAGAVEEAERTAARLQDDLAARQEQLAALERQPGRDGSRLAMNAPVHGLALLAGGATFRSDSGAEPSTTIDLEAGLVVLTLELAPEIEATGLRLEITREDDGRPVYTQTGAPPADPYAVSYVVVLPTADLAPGAYTARLWGEGTGEPRLVGTYAFQVE